MGSSKSNGLVERSVRDVQGLIRTIRSALEHRWSLRIGITHPIWTWLVEYVGYLWTRFSVGKDGKTAYERCKGKKVKAMGMEFGEGALWKRRR